MKAAVFKEKNGQLEIVEKPIPEPAKGWVRIKVHSCGVCHSDFVVKSGAFGNPFPRTPGHEVIGVIDKLGDGVDATRFELGKLVGVGWYGGRGENGCGTCDNCREDQWIFCTHSMVCGIHYDGGYAEYMTCPEDALVFVPEGMDPIESAPLLCAGITVYNSFRNLNIKSGSLVGVQGIGGLGHLGIQFVKKMGYEVIAMSGGSGKKELAKELGAAHYVDMSKDYIDEMKKIGSVKCILVTAPNAQNIQGMLESLGINGKLVLLALLPEPFNANAGTLIGGNKSIVGWASGDSRDLHDTLVFAKNNNVKPMVKSFPLEQAREALDNIGDARFRHVIKLQ
ncbi:hypothetical protein DICPUDRAFT_39372 [Dictyostelium purpureum]|uniref:Enoyl reductase (ER) domain-containing protein n=1 Tax=Dictyostelium purpureum TaxID=5786 RepID=F0ZW79_DICPU|nr:uncharacterized protein DICPUDRAFT_39372 [Dictyostelium purpureum]EGC31808.1 hypothetical protein DICPUDRAFT_39372 [Dictyostelium purpureum]|eukprot:XP_003291675.1 hypothetical protein DICPUDRAFT_39372 [Dictyostelium purpureum]